MQASAELQSHGGLQCAGSWGQRCAVAPPCSLQQYCRPLEGSSVLGPGDSAVQSLLLTHYYFSAFPCMDPAKSPSQRTNQRARCGSREEKLTYVISNLRCWPCPEWRKPRPSAILSRSCREPAAPEDAEGPQECR
ncbi:Hypp9155 [Branchiostoma lanceolatum]|uniref:Hypp9155 protein n=1 Tax=Branchiostoma lanceolatum TaxID=7740 RepID=A0A8K0EI25_BRALA|nr:Hypp9155 [Branchiostoma lanceolatum]